MRFLLVFLFCAECVLSSTLGCGKRPIPDAAALSRINNIPSAIVQGHEVTSGSIPWQVRLAKLNKYNSSLLVTFCGGVLISDRFILTAAHCDVTYGMTVFIGDHSKNTTDAGEVNTTVAYVITHGRFHILPGNVQRNDIALVMLADKLTLSDRIQPICLPIAPVPVGTECIASGWGDLEYRYSSNKTNNVPDKLQAVNLKIVKDDGCREDDTGFEGDEMICAYAEGKDTCQGDSGGPLASNVNGSYTLVGLTSFGYGCATELPGVYTDVYQFVSWIERSRRYAEKYHDTK